MTSIAIKMEIAEIVVRIGPGVANHLASQWLRNVIVSLRQGLQVKTESKQHILK